MPKKSSHPAILIIFLSCVVFIHLFLYKDLIQQDPILGFDDQTLIPPLQKLTSLWDYRPQTDIQPIRDLTFLLEIQISKIIGFSTFHLSNLILWWMITILFYKILCALAVPRSHALLLTALFTFHPIFVNSVAWISARKHLLATLFTFQSTLLLLHFYWSKSDPPQILKRRNFLWPKITFFYILAVFSQPIIIFWPVWSVYFLKTTIKTSSERLPIFKKLISIFIVFLVSLYLQMNYYIFSSRFSDATSPTGNTKILGLGIQTLSTIPQLFGRYFFNLIAPIQSSIDYQVYSPENLIGSVFFILWIYLGLKYLARKIFFIWLFFFFAHLSVVTFNRTHIFVSDTYILTSSLSFFYLTYLLMSSLRLSPSISPKIKIITFSLLIVFFIYRSSLAIIPWKDTLTLYENAYQSQKSYRYGSIYIYGLIHQKNQNLPHQKISSILKELNNPLLNLEYIGAIYEEKNQLTEMKIQRLQEFPLNHHLYFYFLSSLFVQSKNWTEAKKAFGELMFLSKSIPTNLIQTSKIDELAKILANQKLVRDQRYNLLRFS